MNRRHNLMMMMVVLLAAVATGMQSAAAPAKPNLILIMADDLGYETIGANGGTSYRTPVLDQLAKTGARFEHCYAQPICTPSRVQIMTGIYNVRNYVSFGVLDRDETTFAQLLKQAGYATCIAGKWQLGKQADAARHFGFDEACLWQHTRPARDKNSRDTRFMNPHLEINGRPVDYDNGEYGPDVVTDFLCAFIEKNRDRPFLAYYPMILTHSPFVPTPDSRNPSRGNTQQNFADDERRSTHWHRVTRKLHNIGSTLNQADAQQNFADMVAYMDKVIGRIVAKLDELEIRENTLVLFTGDNGTAGAIRSEWNGRPIQGGKGQMTDAGTRVPLIASWPGTIPPGRVFSDLVDFSDFLPTLCDAAGVAVPAALKIDGRSFLPQLKGQTGNPREWIYCWYSRGGGPRAEEWARTQRYKLYRTGKFYDVSADQLEETPLTKLSPEAKQVKASLQQVLDQYQDARPASLSRGTK